MDYFGAVREDLRQTYERLPLDKLLEMIRMSEQMLKMQQEIYSWRKKELKRG